ncbi:hypothetical protein C8A03DRAFT_33172 [Achaetomium macrosporum]|uniref:Calmodulin n=1 Tax=Achaetomium macrosporum TaxID=79813 RepID=A0AAN7CB29_9PEZI|nr:hypothetical protein C8A03DRAFT_33172 [Achaetomium macrosporum]
MYKGSEATLWCLMYNEHVFEFFEQAGMYDRQMIDASNVSPSSGSSSKADQIEQYKQVFEIFDKDGTGDITAAELGNVMKELGLNPSDEELQDLINEVDTNKDGVISFDEFLALMSQTVKEVDTEQELLNAFKVFDKDGSGTISSDELRHVLKKLGENLTDDEVEEMIKLADRNGDGHIDYHEFANIMK